MLITAFIAYFSIRATISYQETVHDSVSDQITFASWNFNRILNKELDRLVINQLGLAFQNITLSTEGNIKFKDESERTAFPCQSCNDGPVSISKSLSQFYIYDLEYSVVDYFFQKKELNSDIGELLIQMSESLSENQISASEFQSSFRFISDAVGDENIIFAFLIPGNNLFGREFIVAVKGPVDIIAPAIEKVWMNEHLIPPNLSGYVEIKEHLYISISTPSGTTLFSTLPEHENIIAFKSATNNLNYLETKLYLKEGITDRTLIGTNSKQQIAFMLGLFGIASILTLFVIILVKKDSDLAKVRSDFLSSASHDLRTPITQIRLFSETLINGRLKDHSEIKSALKVIHHESERLTNIVTNILDFSKIKERYKAANRTQFQVDELITEVLNAFIPQAKDQGVIIQTELEKVQVNCDKHLLRQIVANILDNAIKYSGNANSINISLEKNTDKFVIEIEDFGEGISAKTRTKIWIPYWRDKKYIDSSITGFGLGLAIVKNNISTLNGSVLVKSNEKGGTVFIVKIPLSDDR